MSSLMHDGIIPFLLYLILKNGVCGGKICRRYGAGELLIILTLELLWKEQLEEFLKSKISQLFLLHEYPFFDSDDELETLGKFFFPLHISF